MLRSVNIKEEISIHLQVIADMSYAWHVMDAYTEFMQKGIKQDPSLVVKLRATFLKVIMYALNNGFLNGRLIIINVKLSYVTLCMLVFLFRIM